MSTDALIHEVQDAAKAIGLLHGNGSLNSDWFSHPLEDLGKIFSNADQRDAFLDLLDQLLPPQSVPGLPAGEKWHPLLGDQPRGNVYLTVTDAGGGKVVIGGVGEFRASAGSGTPSASLRARLPLVSLQGTSVTPIAGTADGPLDISLRVQLNWTRPAQSITLTAINVTIHLAPLASIATANVVLEGLDLDGSGAHDTPLDPSNLDSQAMKLVMGLISQKLHEIAGTATGEAAAVAAHFMPLLGFGDPAIPSFPFAGIMQGPAALQGWINSMVSAGSITAWLSHLAGLFGATVPATGSGTLSDPWSVRLLALDGASSELDLLLAKVDQRLYAGLRVLVVPGGASPPTRLEAEAMLVGIPLSGTGPAQVLPSASILLRSPGGAGALIAPGGTISVASLRGGILWNGSALTPLLELLDVTFSGTHYDQIDLTHADSVVAAASAAVKAAILAALGNSATARHLAALAGLLPPAGDAAWPFTIADTDLPKLVSNPTGTIAAMHRSALLSVPHNWGFLLAEVGALAGLTGAISGTGTKADPWRIPFEAAGPLTLELAAWNAQESGNAADPQQLRLGLRLSASSSPWLFWWLAELLAFDLPASGSGDTRLMAGQHAQFLLQPAPSAPALAGMIIGADSLGITLDWNPGSPLALRGTLNNLRVTSNGATITVGSLVFPPATPFDITNPAASIGIATDQLEAIVRLLATRASFSWAGMPGMAFASLTGLGANLPGLQSDWPTLRDFGAAGSMFTDPFGALRDWLARVSVNVSSDGTPFLPQALDWLRALVGDSLPGTPDSGPLMPDDPLQGSGVYEDPWSLPVAATSSSPVELLAWLEPAGPPSNWIAPISAKISDAGAFQPLLEVAALLQPFLPQVRDALAMSDIDALGNALDDLATHLSTSDGVVPVSSQIPTGGPWTTGTPLTSAHPKQPSDPSAIVQVLAQLNTWFAAGPRCVLLLGPAFSDHAIWQPLLAQAETARPGSTSASAYFDLRVPGVDPASVDLRGVTVTADYYTADLRDEGTGNLASLTSQIGNIVGRLGEIRPGLKITLVAHSTAGVAARAYCSANAAKIAGLITIGSPHAGAPLTVLRSAATAESVRLIERLTPALAAGPLKDAVDHLRQALDGALPPASPGGLPIPFPYPVGSFSTTPSTDTGGVPAFALGGVVDGDLFTAVKESISVLASGAAAAATPAPTHISFGLRSTLPVPTAPAGAVQADVKLRADAFRIALTSGAAEPARPSHSLTILASLRRVDGWLAGAPNSYAGEGAPLVDVRVRWAELGATIMPSGNSLTVTPLVRLHQAAFHGPSIPLTQLADSLAAPLLGAILQTISVPAPLAGSSAGVLLDALTKLGVAVPDPHGGVGISSDALVAIQTDAAAYLAPRLPAALSDPAGFLGFGASLSGPWIMPIGAGPLEVYLSNTPEWQIGVRTNGTSRLTMGTTASLGFDARVNIPSFTTELDLSFSLAAITLAYSQSIKQLTVAAPPWLDTFTLVPAPTATSITTVLSKLVPRLLLSGVVSGLLESILPANLRVGPIDRFLASPGSSLSSASSLGSGSGGLDAAKINALLSAIGTAIGAPAGPGLGLPAGLRLSASGTGTITLSLATTTDIGGMLGFALDANIDSLRHVSPAGTLSLHVPLPGTWPGVTIAFGIASSGITLSLTPDGSPAIQLLPAFSGLGALAGTAEALLPSALDEVVKSFGTTPPAFVSLVLNVAQAFDLYDSATQFKGHANQLRALLQGNWLSGLSATIRAQAVSAFEQLFNNVASPLKGVLPGTVSTAGQTVTWTFSPAALGSGSLAVVLGWDSAGPTLNLQTTDFKLNNGPIGLTLGAGYAMNSVQANAALAFHLQSSLGISAAPEFSASFSVAGFQAHLLPLGSGTESVLDIELLPSPGVHAGTNGPVQLLEMWLLPIVADLAVQASNAKLGTNLWTGMTLRQLLNSAGIIGPGDALANPLPSVTTMVTGLLTGLATSVEIALTSTLALKFVSEGGKLGLRIRGHQDFNAGSLTVSALFGEPATWISDLNRGVTLYLFNAAGLSFAPRLEVVGLGVGLSQSDSPLVNTSFLRMGGAAGYLFFNVNLTGGISLENFGAGIDIEQFGIPLGQALGGGASGNPVASSLLQSDAGSSGGDAQPVNPTVDLFAAYRNGTFVIKVAGSDQAIWIGIHRQFGPIYLDQIGLEVVNSSSAVALLVDGSVSIAGLTVQTDELGVTIPLRSLTSPGDWTIDLRGLAVAYSNGGLDIAGGLIKNPGPPIEYDGMLTVTISDLGLTAVGAYSRPSDQLGQYTSLFIFVALDFPLGGPPFFFVTGLGGGGGYNRRLLVPTDPAQVPNFLLVKAIDGSGFANDPMSSLRGIATSIPPKRGSLWFAAGVKFDSFVLVHTIALVCVSLDKGFAISLLGVSRMAMPTENLAIASVELAVSAGYSAAEGVLSSIGVLTDNSYIFARAVRLTGGFAFFMWFPKGQFVLSLGGYNPNFDKPAQFPDLPRLGFRWQQFPVSIKGEAYFALTNSCVMAGGRLEAVYDLDIVRAWFIAYADFLISWDPFHYDIQIGVSVGAALDFEVCFIVCGHVHLEVSIGASLHVVGPQLHADVSVDLDVTSVTISFGADPAQHPNYITDFNVFQQKYLSAGSPSDVPVVVRVTQGLLPPEPPGAPAAPGSKDQPWALRAEFVFTTESRMPASSFSSFLAPAVPVIGVASLDLAAMNKQAISSVHDVRIFLGDSMSPAQTDAQHFSITPNNGLFPEATWRFTKEGEQKAAANTLQALSGLTITASAVMRGQSALIPISSMVDDLPDRSLPLPFATLSVSVVSGLKLIGASAEQLSLTLAPVSNDKMLAGAAQILSGTNQFSALRKQTGLPPSGLSSMAQRSLLRMRSAPPMVAPLSSGLTMKSVGLDKPPVIFRKLDTPPVVLDRPRLRATLQGRPSPTTDAPPAIRTTVKNASGAVRMTPPRLTPLAGSRLDLLPASNAPRATRAAIARRSIQNPETGMLSGLAHGSELAKAADQLQGQGIILPSGTTHVWDVPPQSSHTFLLQGGGVARVICMDDGGHVLLDREMVADAQRVVTPANTSTVIFICLGTLPAGLKIPTPGFGIVSFAAAPAFGLPAVGWQAGDSREKVGPSTLIGRGSSIILPRPAHVDLRKQNASLAMVRVADAIRGQAGTETWLPSAVSTVMIILDGQDTAAATDGDFALAVENATLTTPPIPVAGGRRRTLLYDVAGRIAGTDHFVVSVASKSGWSISGVVGLAGKAIEWANRFHGNVPERITADGPLSAGGSVQVRLLPPAPPTPAPGPVPSPTPILRSPQS